MKKKKLLSLNVYYAPRSFGGATIVAEQVNQILRYKFDYEILVITTTENSNLVQYHVEKYEVNGIQVISINIPKHLNYIATYQNEEIANIVRRIILSFEPDIAHLHSIQLLGATFIRELKQENIPIFATLHDCWWICDRQFMINKHQKYCFQTKVNPSVCLHCVDDIESYEKRQSYLKGLLLQIDYYLFPSNFHRDLHIMNGFPREKCFTNKNGIKSPNSNYQKTKGKKGIVRFGFVGGPGKIKGAPLIKEAFETIDNDNYELIVVDGAQNLGKSWNHAFRGWNIKGKMTVVPAYTQDTMDDFYKNIDVLLFPSQWKESFGLTVREALIRNIFIISTNGGGTTEDLVENENAIIIPITNNPEPLRNAVLKVLESTWKKYKNPYKHKITTYEEQAQELNQLFALSLVKNHEKHLLTHD